MKSKVIKLTPKTFTKADQSQMLLREFIHDRLYGLPDQNPNGGYFTQEKHQVGRLKDAIKFSQCRGYYDYRQEMERLYPENAWVTPCELFKPYYSYTIANFMLNQVEDRKIPLKVVEIGPGTGTFADSCLDFFKNYDLGLYRQSEYTFCEISPQLAESCEKTMRQNHRQLFDEGRIKIYNSSFMDFDQKLDGRHFVVGLEILDNMPHDRLVTGESVGQAKSKGFTHASIVSAIHQQELVESFKSIEEINDELINLFLKLWESRPAMDHVQANKRLKSQGLLLRLVDAINSAFKPKTQFTLNNNIFAPTATLKLFQQLKKVVPNHSLILADFDSFMMPRGSVQGENAPMVTHKLKDPTEWTTYETYLCERGHADICFPTDFYFLQHAYQQITGHQAQVYKTKEFVDQFALQSWCQTQNLYNPMREEYFNTSFLVSQ